MSSRILVALRVAASPERAFDVFTGDIGSWWRPAPLFAFTSEGPAALTFEGGEGGRLVQLLPGGKMFEIGKVRLWERPDRLVFGWRQASFPLGCETEVEVRFEAVGEETRVTVEHRGWDAVPAENAARHGFPNTVFLERHGAWWREMLWAYKDRIAVIPEDS